MKYHSVNFTTLVCICTTFVFGRVYMGFPIATLAVSCIFGGATFGAPAGFLLTMPVSCSFNSLSKPEFPEVVALRFVAPKNDGMIRETLGRNKSE